MALQASRCLPRQPQKSAFHVPFLHFAAGDQILAVNEVYDVWVPHERKSVNCCRRASVPRQPMLLEMKEKSLLTLKVGKECSSMRFHNV